MISIWIGVVAGFVATVVLSALMLMQQRMQVMPQMDMIGMSAGMMKSSRTVAWLVHFMAGTLLYGGAFLVLLAVLRTNAYLGTGILLGTIGWLISNVTFMPMAGKGVFGMKVGVMAPIMSLVMHLIFGALLGWVYAGLIT